MSTPQEATLEISYPKAYSVSVVWMACFFVGVFFLGVPMRDHALVAFLIFMGIVMPFVFAGCLCFMLRCKIGYDGLRPAVPTFYQMVIRWQDISFISGFAAPFYSVKCHGIGSRCVLPRAFLLKRPESLREFVKRFAPEDNIIRKTLAP